MAVFDKDIIDIEGEEYTNDPHDHGGATKFGISQRSYPNLDIKNLTLDQALEIYERDYWSKNNLGSVQDQTTANIIFRFIVHRGAHDAVILLQNALNTFVPIIPSIKVDGILGSRTLQAINNVRTIRLQDTLRVLICKYYLRVVQRDLTQKKYFQGWIRRALM